MVVGCFHRLFYTELSQTREAEPISKVQQSPSQHMHITFQHALSFSTGMSFAWLCRNTFESFPELVTSIINGTVDFLSDFSSGFSTSSGQGCYRDGQYLLSNATKFELRTSRMVPDETYEIVLVVRKDNRTSSTTQLLELGTEDILNLTIRYEY